MQFSGRHGEALRATINTDDLLPEQQISVSLVPKQNMSIPAISNVCTIAFGAPYRAYWLVPSPCLPFLFLI